MLNKDKYKTIEEMNKAYLKDCSKQKECCTPNCNYYDKKYNCAMKWIFSETEDKENKMN